MELSDREAAVVLQCAFVTEKHAHDNNENIPLIRGGVRAFRWEAAAAEPAE
jgi:hypothetical protein